VVADGPAAGLDPRVLEQIYGRSGEPASASTRP